jgi:hypothetical protein
MLICNRRNTTGFSCLPQLGRFSTAQAVGGVPCLLLEGAMVS